MEIGATGTPPIFGPSPDPPSLPLLVSIDRFQFGIKKIHVLCIKLKTEHFYHLQPIVFNFH